MPFARLVLADFRERTRRYSYLVTLAIALYGAYLFTPPNHASYVTLEMGETRGIYNSAWIGTLVAMLSALFLSIAGFYVVKNAVTRDESTRVGQILAATRISRGAYLSSKFVSNLLVLSSVVAVLIVGTAAMQLIRGEDPHIRPVTLLLPFFIITLPVMVAVSAMAVLFDSVRWLRGGWGNVLFFVIWMAAVSTEALQAVDIMGMSTSIDRMTAAAHAAYPSYSGDRNRMSLGFSIRDEGKLWDLRTFEWGGIDWTAGMIAPRLALICTAGLLLGGASLAFDRFAREEGALSARRRRKAARRRRRISLRIPDIGGGPFVRLVVAELRVMFRGVNGWWLLVALGLIAAGAALPAEYSGKFVLPIAWIWPLMYWSAMGTREHRFGTSQIFSSAPMPVKRQIPAHWTAGFLAALFTGSGVAARLLVEHGPASIAPFLAGAAFIPAFALAAGLWTGSSKFFEIVYLLIWYAGPVSGFPPLDFMGASASGFSAGWFLVSVILFLLALAAMRRQISS